MRKLSVALVVALASLSCPGKIAHAINGTWRCSLGWLPGKY
jgi:hypothetical protein